MKIFFIHKSIVLLIISCTEWYLWYKMSSDCGFDLKNLNAHGEQRVDRSLCPAQNPSCMQAKLKLQRLALHRNSRRASILASSTLCNQERSSTLYIYTCVST